MATATPNHTVTVHFQGRTAGGEVFAEAGRDNPFTFQLDDEAVMPAFRAAIKDMRPGETRTFQVPAAEAYGPHLPELVQTLPRDRFKADIAPGAVVGLQVEKDGQQHTVPAQVVAVSGDTVTVDYNHPLAGQDLEYTVTLVAVSQEDGAGAPVS